MTDKKIKLNLGSGEKPMTGYENIDVKAGRMAFPLDDYDENSIESIRASHILEHFPHSQIKEVIANWVSKLMPGGILWLAVPDFQKIATEYLERKPVNIEGYIMGGQAHEHDYHKSLFDEPGLRRMMTEAGLIDIMRWRSEIDDCASLPISLNLMGKKQEVTAERILRPEFQKIATESLNQTQVRVAAVMSVPRLAITNNFACMFRAISDCGIPCRPGQGVFWHHAMTRQIEDRIEEGYELLLAVDFDTWFLPGHVKRLIELLMSNPQADAVCAVQCEREGPLPIMGIHDDQGKPVLRTPRSEFQKPLTRIHIGHFGLTLFRANCFENLSKPWFDEEPDPNGSWREGRKDADVAFWKNFEENNCNLYMANEVNIGHLQEVCTFSGQARDNWRPVHVYLRDLNAGLMPEHCKPEFRLEEIKQPI